MKKILALTISSLVMTGAYAAEPVRAKTTEQRVVVIDDNNRRAILAALGTSDEEAHAVAALSPTPVEQPKNKVKTETVTTSKEKVVATVAPTPVEKKPIKVPEITKVESKVVATVEKTVEKKPEAIAKEVKAPVVAKVEPTPAIKKDLPLPVIKPAKIDKPVETKKEFTPILAATKTSEATCSCDTPKKVVKPVKRVSYKKVTKKIVKKTKSSNELDFVKLPYSVSEAPYGTKVVTYINNREVASNLTYAKDTKSLTLSIAHVNGQALKSEDFINTDKDAQISAYLMNTDLSNMEKQNIQVLANQKDYHLNLSNNVCKALFIQYQLKGSNEQHSLVKYFDTQGNMSLNVDSKCPSVKANTQDNLTYSNDKYTTGIFMNNASLSEKNPLAYNIIVNRNGQSFIPGTLKSFVVSKDLSQFYDVKSVSKGALGISGATYSQKLGRGVYYVVAQFPGEKKEQGITVEVNIH